MLRYCVLLLISASIVICCKERRTELMFLDIASEMIDKAKLSSLQETHWSDVIQGPLDCADIFYDGHNISGVYSVWPVNRLTQYKSVKVYCDMDTDGGGWTVIQRRGDFLKEEDYFFKDWKSYKEGFGNIEEDFWLGNGNIFALTNQKMYSVRFDLESQELEKRYALYDKFWIDDEFQNYTLHISDYSGDAGESLIKEHHLQRFSTKDRDNDVRDVNCAEHFKGGWWYGSCYDANLNGLYVKDRRSNKGITWRGWLGTQISLKSTEIKIRPLSFKRNPTIS